MSFQADGGWPAEGRDAEHSQLPVAHGRPAGAGGHCQRLQGPEQGRAQPWPPRHLVPRKLLAQSAPSGHPGWCVAGQRPLDFALHSGVRGHWVRAEARGAAEGPWLALLLGTLGLERGLRTQSRHWEMTANLGAAEAGSWACAGSFCLEHGVAHETYCAVSSEMLRPADQAPVPAPPLTPESAGCRCHYCRL